MRFLARPSMKRFAGCLTAVGLVWLSGCATGANPQSIMAQRAEAQQDMARLDSQPVQADSRATYVQLVSQMQGKGLYFASLAHIEALQQRWGVDAESNLLLADALRQTGQADKAQAIYKPLLTSPVKARAAHGLGLLAGRSGQFEVAVQHLQEAALAAPTDANILNDLGFALMQLGQWSSARVPLLKAAELAADNPRVWSNIALFLTLNGQADQANDLMNGRNLSATSRAQIAELAAAIGRRKGTSVPPLRETVPFAADTTSARLVLSPSRDLSRLAAALGGPLTAGDPGTEQPRVSAN